MKNSKPDGFHFLLEFFGCDVEQINSMDFWQSELRASIAGTSMEALHDFYYQFNPEGITGYLLLSSSHISIHTWPENNYVCCDVFTCATEQETEQAVRYLKQCLTYERVETKKLPRGHKVTRKRGIIRDFDQCTLNRHSMPIKRPFSDEIMMLDAIQVLVEIETGSQTIQIVDSANHGKCLVIDGMIQAAQKDHYLHDRELVKKLRPNDSTILIIGGGNGYVAQRVIAENPFASVNVDIVDCEHEVVSACERYLGQDVFKDELVKVYTEDICSYLEGCGKLYDGIAIDFLKPSIGSFWQRLLSLANQRVRDNGWIALRVGKVMDGELSRLQSVKTITRFLEQNGWRNIEDSEVMVPSSGESSPFLFGVKSYEK